MTKVVIDSFDTEEQAIAFVDWFRKQMFSYKCKLITTEGTMLPEWDGVDLAQTNKEQITFNIIVFNQDDDVEDEGF